MYNSIGNKLKIKTDDSKKVVVLKGLTKGVLVSALIITCVGEVKDILKPKIED